ncbi:hypothetical protein [Crossiella sp. CA198]|uniref:hypothetical protein n=1 Tax=Crossiella sp. CA198 TaxID=3455607 RepID=UPI003F8D4326
MLNREVLARRGFYEASVSHADALAAFRHGVIGYLKSRHPLRTERLKKDGFPLGPNTTESTLLAAMAQWDQMRDGELRHSAERAVQDELTALRARNAALEADLAKHTEQRNADQAIYLDRLHHYEEQVQKLTGQLGECANDRRELSRGAVRLADHITSGDGALPTLFRRPDWYRRWADIGVAKPPKKSTPDIPAAKPKPAPPLTGSRWPEVSRSYQKRWGETVLRDLWGGSLWTRSQLDRDGMTAERSCLVDKLVEHHLVTLHDPGHAEVLTVTDELGAFATEVGARLGSRRPSVAQRALDAMNRANDDLRQAVLRVLAHAGRDHHLRIHPGRPDQVPLVSSRPLTGPRLPARWLLPWLADQPELMRDLLARARAKDEQSSLVVAVHRRDDGADDALWGPLVKSAGYDPAEVKRIWLPPNG